MHHIGLEGVEERLDVGIVDHFPRPVHALRDLERGQASLECVRSIFNAAVSMEYQTRFLRINGKLQYLWRAVDQDGDVLDILVQSRRNKKAATKFFRKLLKGLQNVPRAIITDRLRSYAAAKAEVMPSVEHHRDKGLNNRAENSHQPTCERERRMRGFKSPGHAQRFLSTFGVIASFFRPGRERLPQPPEVPAGEVEVYGVADIPTPPSFLLGGASRPGPGWGRLWPYLDLAYYAQFSSREV